MTFQIIDYLFLIFTNFFKTLTFISNPSYLCLKSQFHLIQFKFIFSLHSFLYFWTKNILMLMWCLMTKFAVHIMFTFIKHCIKHAKLCLWMLFQTFLDVTVFITNFTWMEIFVVFLLTEVELLKYTSHILMFWHVIF